MYKLSLWPLAASLILSACAGKTIKDKEAPRPDPEGAHKLWSVQVPGLISDLDVSQDGRRILLTIVPDPDGDGSVVTRNLMLDQDGSILWDEQAPFRIKHQTLSPDGSLSLFVTHNEEIYARDSQGKLLWSATANCDPSILANSARIICYHDDDARPEVAFETYDLGGNKQLTFPAKLDALVMRTAYDDSLFALGFVDGWVSLFSPKPEAIWQKRMKGEVVDLAIAPSSLPAGARVAVLQQLGTGGQRVSVLNFKGKLIAEFVPEHHSEQLAFQPGVPNHIALYGNGPAGQMLSLVDYEARPTPAGQKGIVSLWKQSVPRAADFSSTLSVSASAISLGFEGAEDRRPSLHGYAWDGRRLWMVPVESDEGAYLFAHAQAAAQRLVYIGTDDSRVSAYAITRSGP